MITVLCIFSKLFTCPPNAKLRQTHFSLSVHQPFFPSQVRTNKAEFESLGEDAWWMHEAPLSDGWNDGKEGWFEATPCVVVVFWLKKQFEDLEIED